MNHLVDIRFGLLCHCKSLEERTLDADLWVVNKITTGQALVRGDSAVIYTQSACNEAVFLLFIFCACNSELHRELAISLF